MADGSNCTGTTGRGGAMGDQAAGMARVRPGRIDRLASLSAAIEALAAAVDALRMEHQLAIEEAALADEFPLAVWEEWVATGLDTDEEFDRRERQALAAADYDAGVAR